MCEFNEKIFTASTWGLPLHDPTLGNCVCVFLFITRSAQVTALPVVCEFNETIFTASTWRLPLHDSTLGSCVCVCVCVFLLITRSVQVTVLLVAYEFNELGWDYLLSSF